MLLDVAILHLNGTPTIIAGRAETRRRGMMFVLPRKRRIAIFVPSFLQKLKAKKAYQLKKAKDISKDLEDSLLGSDDPPSSTPASSATASASTDKSSAVDPLQLTLERLDSMQGRLVALEMGRTSVSSNEVNMAKATPVTEEQT